jgi:hypothetical protein
MGFAGLKNGELLKQAEASGFDVFITGDKTLEYEQDMRNRKIRDLRRALQSSRTIASRLHELYDAAERFRQDFEPAQLMGSYARMDLNKSRRGRQEITDNIALAKVRIDKALDDLGNGKHEPSFS